MSRLLRMKVHLRSPTLSRASLVDHYLATPLSESTSAHFERFLHTQHQLFVSVRQESLVLESSIHENCQ